MTGGLNQLDSSGPKCSLSPSTQCKEEEMVTLVRVATNFLCCILCFLVPQYEKCMHAATSQTCLRNFCAEQLHESTPNNLDGDINIKQFHIRVLENKSLLLRI